MGVHSYFKWLKRVFSNHIKEVNVNQGRLEYHTDIFLVDLNGLFHSCCQKVYQYGQFKPQKSLLHPNRKIKEPKMIEVLQEICSSIDTLVTFVDPKKVLYLAVDGVAPMAKQTQQRARRIRSSVENNESTFNTACITPGTSFLNDVSSYIDKYIQKKITEGSWKFQVIFSNEKVPHEGEHKLIRYVKEYVNDDDAILIVGMDADLAFLSMSCHKKNFCILRDNQRGYFSDYYYINMKEIRESLVIAMIQELPVYAEKLYINDFILLVYGVGNDFLPTIPSLSIEEDSIEKMFEIYSEVVKSNGLLTTPDHKLNLTSLKIFFQTLAVKEEEYLVNKKTLYPDTLIDKYKTNDKFDFVGYRKEYYLNKIGIDPTEENIKNVVVAYVEGLQWVFTYYMDGCSCWSWIFQYAYSPLLSDIGLYIDSYDYIPFQKTTPIKPMLQLMCVLPKSSHYLLPQKLGEIMLEQSDYTLNIDLDGKNASYQGVVTNLPKINLVELTSKYNKVLHTLTEQEQKRNIQGNVYLYKREQNMCIKTPIKIKI